MPMSFDVSEFQTVKRSSPAAGDTGFLPDAGRRRETPGWFQARVGAAWEEFQKSPLPGPKEEAWRYSSAKRLALDALHPAAAPSEAEAQQATARSRGLEKTSARFVFLNDALVSSGTAS